ncbi:hypothetical protein BT93_L2342 [Corymbia citriodora subsp. variegata]|uniref:Uncharacterized protein n=1 Tax=Corymbia citriodora subsp. variegata TaxID=360336 RepID=A0A8T0CPP5_CORYI|nr:hypothetical protein BT93_L2342 [Corymbia citriodora subsp. variegata]
MAGGRVRLSELASSSRPRARGMSRCLSPSGAYGDLILRPRYIHLKIIKLLMTGRNKEITPHVRNYRISPLRSNNSIELSMIVCVIASTTPGISMNPIIAIAQDTLF